MEPMEKVEPLLTLAFRAVALALAAVTLALATLGFLTTAVVTVAVGLFALVVADFIRDGAK
jgi:hypothetical protein